MKKKYFQVRLDLFSHPGRSRRVYQDKKERMKTLRLVHEMKPGLRIKEEPAGIPCRPLYLTEPVI